jgi:hypothetical protein
MMNILRSSAAILLTAASLAVTAVPASALGGGNTTFDLGVDTSHVPYTTAGVSGFLATEPAQSRSVILSSCARYVTTPNAVRSQDTIDFCSIALNSAAPSNIRTFSSVAPFVVAPAPSFAMPRAPSLKPDCTLPHYTVDPSDPCY